MTETERSGQSLPAGTPAAGVPDPGTDRSGGARGHRIMRHAALRRAVGIGVIYRSNGGGLVVGGLSYAALFALLPTIVLVVAGLFYLVDDPGIRRQAVEVLGRAFPAFADVADTAVQNAHGLAAVGGVIALLGFMWGASGLYLNLARAMERFFPGERVSGVLARAVGVLLVVAIIVGVLAAVLMAGVVTVIARALELDAEWVLTAVSVLATLVLATAIVYGIYRAIPANPPGAGSARLPAVLAGIVVASSTWLYSLLSPWLVGGFEMFGVAASVFVALVWLRVVFLAVVYGAAMARYLDYVHAAEILGEAEPDAFATRHALAEEARRSEQEMEDIHLIESRAAAAASGTSGGADEATPAGGGEGPDPTPGDRSGASR